MALSRLDVTDFRNLASAKLQPILQGFNFLYGKNGSGKTSLLEAIYYLSLGRSFRTATITRIINKTAGKFSIFANLEIQSNQQIPIGIERHQNGDIKIRISGKDARSAVELASLTPVQLINSNCFNLLDAPGYRRKYLDWGAFYLSADFVRAWRQFERTLKQRNAALRNHQSRQELDAWTQELITHSILLEQLRREYIQFLFPKLVNTVNELLIIDGLEINYQPGWDEELDYQDVLRRSIDRDLQLGYTQYGPHRGDLKITVNKTPAKDILSRGQQKLFVCAMLLTQGALLQSANKKPIYLVDDLPSELDATSRSNLMALLSKQESQIFVTAVEREILDAFLRHHPTKMFHVEHGSISV